MQNLKTHKTFEGKTQFWEHDSVSTKTKMKFSTFIPSGPVKGCLIWLSGLTCTDENFITKAGSQKVLAELGLMIVCPDTSPRGLNLPGEHDSWDFGSGASFYVDATAPGYKDHYLMETYVVEELHKLIQDKFSIPAQKIALFGHSMGGHGALTLGLRHPQKFASVSAFSPIVNPMKAPWGVKAFTGYFGNNEAEWAKHDATELLRQGRRHPQTLLIDQGTEDEFLAKGQLLTDNIKTAAAEVGQKMEVNMRDGYDHSYYFISTFVESHLRFHAQNLN